MVQSGSTNKMIGIPTHRFPKAKDSKEDSTDPLFKWLDTGNSN